MGNIGKKIEPFLIQFLFFFTYYPISFMHGLFFLVFSLVFLFFRFFFFNVHLCYLYFVLKSCLPYTIKP